MLVVDAHLDLAWNALRWERDLCVSVYTTRTREATTPGKNRAQNTVALPEMRRGKVMLCFATLLARATGHPVPGVDYPSAAGAYGAAQGQLAYYRALETEGHLRIITTADQLKNHISMWQTWEMSEQNAPAPPLGIIISMESADPILKAEDVPTWWRDGVRIIGPAHYGPGRYAGGTSAEAGFTPDGLSLLEYMDAAGIILDLTHLTDQGFWEALDHFNGPVLASHNNCRSLVPHQRQFDDAQLNAIISRGGVIGASLDAWMLQPGWVKGISDNRSVSLAHVVDHIDHVCQLAGNSQHAAIGTDLDGGFGREQSPADLDTIADLQLIPFELESRGYRQADIKAIMSDNWLNLLRTAWKAENTS